MLGGHLFVGGPLDGQWRAINGSPYSLRFPTRPIYAQVEFRPCWGGVVLLDVLTEIETIDYTRRTFASYPDEEINIYAEASLCDAEVIRRLLSSYRGGNPESPLKDDCIGFTCFGGMCDGKQRFVAAHEGVMWAVSGQGHNIKGFLNDAQFREFVRLKPWQFEAQRYDLHQVNLDDWHELVYAVPTIGEREIVSRILTCYSSPKTTAS